MRLSTFIDYHQRPPRLKEPTVEGWSWYYINKQEKLITALREKEIGLSQTSKANICQFGWPINSTLPRIVYKAAQYSTVTWDVRA